ELNVDTQTRQTLDHLHADLGKHLVHDARDEYRDFHVSRRDCLCFERHQISSTLEGFDIDVGNAADGNVVQGQGAFDVRRSLDCFKVDLTHVRRVAIDPHAQLRAASGIG